MSFVRPEARAALWRVRELLAGAALAALGMWLVMGYGLTVWLGYAALILSAGLIMIGVQRARFRTGGGGPGIVGVDEGQIGYFGPLNGGVVAVADLTCLTLDGSGHPAHWILDAHGAQSLAIPVNAEGAEALFDVFTQLPGLKTSRVLAELDARPTVPVVLWQRAPSARARIDLI